jgi:hypothetical protein
MMRPLPDAGAARHRLRRSWLVAGCCFLLFLAITLGFQFRSGAYGTELATLFPDEASHFVNSVLVQQFLRYGIGHAPMRFAADFYLAFPKVSIGHWPPMFYLFAGSIMALTAATTTVALLISAAITAALATTMAAIARQRHGTAAGVVAGAMFLILPIVRQSATSLMVDICIALLMLIATWIEVRAIAALRVGWSVAFAVVASIAILTKGNGMALALLPPVLLVLTGRWHALRSLAFWLPLPIVAALCGPWNLMWLRASASGWVYAWGLEYTRLATVINAVAIAQLVGPVGLALALFGGVRAVRAPFGERPLSVGLLALVIADFVFQAIIPAELLPRYLIPIVVALVVLAIDGVADLDRMMAERLGRMRDARVRLPMIAAVVIGAIAPAVYGLRQPFVKPSWGMVDAAADVIEHGQGGPQAVLIGSDSGGEGAFIAEVASATPRAGWIVVRGFKLLATDDFNGTAYVPRFADATQVGEAVERLGIAFVVIDTRPKSQGYRHNEQILDAARQRGWLPIGRFPHGGPEATTGETLVFEVVHRGALDTPRIAELEGLGSLTVH